MLRISLCLVAAMLAGCASSEIVKSADGRAEPVINCPGLLSSWDACYVNAAERCGPKGYQVIDKVKDTDPVSPSPGVVTTAGSAKYRWIKVRCKP
jgi:hypothetical protein